MARDMGSSDYPDNMGPLRNQKSLNRYRIAKSIMTVVRVSMQSRTDSIGPSVYSAPSPAVCMKVE